MTKIEERLERLENLVAASGKEIMSVNDFVLFSGLTKSHVYKLVHERKIPHFKSAGGKMTFFRKEDVVNWMCAHRVTTAAESEREAVAYCVNNPIN